MKALVLAAGKGSRLGTAAGGMPKPLIDVAGTTPLEHAIRWLAPLDLERIWINVSEHAGLVRDRIGEGAGAAPVSYSHEPELLGTAGALHVGGVASRSTGAAPSGSRFLRDATARLDRKATPNRCSAPS